MSDQEKVTENREQVLFDEVDQLRNHMADLYSDYPEHLVDEIIEKREQVVPKLLAILDEFFAQPIRNMSREQWREGMFVFLLLANMREQKAFEYVVCLCSLPHETLGNFAGDYIQAHAAGLLASTFNGDWDTLYSLVTDPYRYEYSRVAVLEAYVILYKNYVMSREELLKLFADLFTVFYDDFSIAPSALVKCCYYIHATELTEQTEKYFLKKIVDSNYISQDQVKECFARQCEEVLHELHYYRDCLEFVEDLEWGSRCLFIEKPDEPDYWESKEYELNESVKKVGRNEKCPCGSGKKHKKCCLN